MGFSETLNLFLRAYKESVKSVTYQVLCFSITMNRVYNIRGGGKLDCKQLYNGLFVYSDSLPRSEPWSFIKNRRPNIECTFSNRLKSGTNLSSFLFFFFSMKISNSSNVCSLTTKLYAEAYCVRDTLHVDNTKLRLCSEWLQYGGLYKWLLNLHISLWNSLLSVSKIQFADIGFTFTATKPKEDFLTISPCCQLIMK